jgi:hypothetical protein
MARTVFETELTLYPSLSESHTKSGMDILHAIRQKHPEYEQLTWSFSMSEFDDGTAHIRITVFDPAQPSARENFNLIGWIVLIMLFCGLLLYA